MYTVHQLAGQFMTYDRVISFSLKSWVLTCRKWKMKLPLPRIRLKFLLPCGKINGFWGTWLIPTANCQRFGHGKPAVLMSLRNVATVMTYLISGASTSWQSSITNGLYYILDIYMLIHNLYLPDKIAPSLATGLMSTQNRGGIWRCGVVWKHRGCPSGGYNNVCRPAASSTLLVNSPWPGDPAFVNSPWPGDPAFVNSPWPEDPAFVNSPWLEDPAFANSPWLEDPAFVNSPWPEDPAFVNSPQ